MLSSILVNYFLQMSLSAIIMTFPPGKEGLWNSTPYIIRSKACLCKHFNEKIHAPGGLTASRSPSQAARTCVQYILTGLTFLHMMTAAIPLLLQWYQTRFLQGYPSHGNGAGNASDVD
jgi:hypothetical protein